MDHRAQEWLQHEPCSWLVVLSAGGEGGGGRERQGSLQPCPWAGKGAVILLWCCFFWESSPAMLQSHVLPRVPGTQVLPQAHQDAGARQSPARRDPELLLVVARACTKPGKKETEQSVCCQGGCVAWGENGM